MRNLLNEYEDAKFIQLNEYEDAKFIELIVIQSI